MAKPSPSQASIVAGTTGLLVALFALGTGGVAVGSLARERGPACDLGENMMVRSAEVAFDSATRLLAKKDVAPENRFRAWTVLHYCLLDPEGLRAQRPDLYALANRAQRELDDELDRKCKEILADGMRWEGLKDPKKALDGYMNGLAWFPESNDEHPCRAKLEHRISDQSEILSEISDLSDAGL